MNNSGRGIVFIADFENKILREQQVLMEPDPNDYEFEEDWMQGYKTYKHHIKSLASYSASWLTKDMDGREMFEWEDFEVDEYSKIAYPKSHNLTPNKMMCPRCQYVGDDFSQIVTTTATAYPQPKPSSSPDSGLVSDAIEFEEWILNENTYSYFDGKWSDHNGIEWTEGITTSELYNLFLKSKNKTK